MQQDAFIRNAWYVAGRSEDFGRELKPMKLLGDAVVFFRRRDGAIVALEDACPHRKLPLSMGTLKDDAVVCGYHGLTFDGTGTCIAAPTQENMIPKRARVASWPAVERYGFVWVWPGDPAAADHAALLDIPHFDDPSWGRTARGALGIACNYLWITDNLLDPSHVAWVHLTSFAGAGSDNLPLEMEEDDDRVIVYRWIHNKPAPPYYAPFLPFAQDCDRKQHYEMRLPAIAINMSVYAPGGSGGSGNDIPESSFVNVSYNFITPVDADNSLYFWFQHRNQRADDEEMSQRMFAGATMAFNEDKDVLEAVHRGMKNPKTPNINLGLDAGALRFRRKVERGIATQGAYQEASEASVMAG